MPSSSRRKDIDGRGERFESEIRSSQVANGVFLNRREIPTCMKCHAVFEEKSRHCPRCDTHSMALIKPIPEKYLEESRRGAIRRSRQRLGLE